MFPAVPRVVRDLHQHLAERLSAMLRKLVGKTVYIRLVDENDAFVATVRYGYSSVGWKHGS